ncbi:hypothetical protein Kpho02_10250 [Kitasatospora phosalacinea]|uniref:Uncharacterized protein n=1 Tax=Kitasatospora phosalacinea TaxID=2065 RepID=A0A9W6Q4P4_9ACTN|nr:hypothetical protein Kpho02_10250 [Kitasatospora phosalacinea]
MGPGMAAGIGTGGKPVNIQKKGIPNSTISPSIGCRIGRPAAERAASRRGLPCPPADAAVPAQRTGGASETPDGRIARED